MFVSRLIGSYSITQRDHEGGEVARGHSGFLTCRRAQSQQENDGERAEDLNDRRSDACCAT